MVALIAWWARDASALAPDAPAQAIAAEGARLLARWNEPHRSYHTPQHLVEMLAALDELMHAGEFDARQSLLARVAAWYHDVQHDPRAEPGSSEHRSAALARDHLHALGAEDAVADEVERLVLLTVEHRPPDGPGDRLARAFCDADLWVLSAPRERYDEYTAQVRAEHAHVPEPLFRQRRREVLEGLLGTGIYSTPHGRARWLPGAHGNLARELAALRG